MNDPGMVQDLPPEALTGGPAGGPLDDVRRDATAWLVVASIGTVACNGWFLTIAGGVMCFLAIQASDRGHVADAAAKLRWGRILTVAGMVLGVVMALVFLYVFMTTTGG